MSVVSAEQDAYRAGFERFALSTAATSEPAWLRERRTAAFARFVELGFPTPRDEAWRHTPTAPLTRVCFEPADPGARPEPEVLALLPRAPSRGLRVVLVNGRLSPELSRLDPGLAGVAVMSLREALASRPASLEPWLARVASGASAGVFAQLNTALAADAAVVLIAPGTVLDEAVRVEHVGAGGAAGTAAYSRTLVVAGRGSESRIVEVFASVAARASLSNAVTELALEDGASIDRCKLQLEGSDALHVATLAVRLGRDARFYDHSLVLGAALSRDDIDVRFEGEGGECALDGLFVVDGRRVADTHSRIDHARPHCSSRELYKGILDDQARGVFNGLVIVRPGAAKTDAWQMNRNLLLSTEALVHSTPQLEILADDVKCKHGSTTGQLDPAALFYLRSRGIGEAAARGLLTWAFASELLQKVRDEAVRAAVAERLQARLPGAAGLVGVAS
jgi:Fe-S cluster assembly protein SufD